MKFFNKYSIYFIGIGLTVFYISGVVYAAVVTPAFPAALNNFSEGDVIEEEDWNAIERTIGETSSTSVDTLHGKWADLFASTTLPQITTLSNLVTTGALNSGSITSGFGTINIGSSALDAGAGTLTGLTLTGAIVNSTTATSTFSGDISVSGLMAGAFFEAPFVIATSTTATSTIAGGLRITGGGFRTSTLISCDTIDTNADGDFICGSDATGAGEPNLILTVVSGTTYNRSSTTGFAFLAADGVVMQASSTAASGLTVVGNFSLDEDTINDFDADATISIVSSALRVVDLNCSDCIGTAEISDDYVLLAGDTSSSAYTWTGLHTFSNASSTLFSVTGTAYFGGTATSTFDSAGVLTLATDLAVTSGGTGVSALDDILGTTNEITVSAGADTIIGGDVTLSLPALVSLTQASSTRFSVFDTAYFGGTATSTFDSAGVLTLVGNLVFDAQTFDSFTDDATLSNIGGDLRVVDLNCTDCIGETEISDVYLVNNADDTTTGVLTASSFIGTSGTATSTFDGDILVSGLSVGGYFEAPRILATSTTATSTFSGNVLVSGDLEVSGIFFGPTRITSTGDVTVDGALVVTGTSDLQGNVSDSLGIFTIADDLSVTGTARES